MSTVRPSILRCRVLQQSWLWADKAARARASAKLLLEAAVQEVAQGNGDARNGLVVGMNLAKRCSLGQSMAWVCPVLGSISATAAARRFHVHRPLPLQS